MTLTHFASTFDISSTIRPTTIKPCKVLLLNVLTRQIPWPGDLDLYFGCSDFDIIYVNIPDLLKCKTSSHQTLHTASPRCTDLAGILTRWPWPIFCASVPFTHFMSTFNISSTIRPTTVKPRIVLLLYRLHRYLDWGGAKVLCILHHWGVQLILAYSWARPAILVVGKGRGGMFLFLLFLHFHSCSSFFPVPLFHLLYSLFYLFSPFLWETTQNDPQGLTCR